MKEKFLSALSMARGAGKLVLGYDGVAASIGKDAVLVLCTKDCSERTLRNIQHLCEGVVPFRVVPWNQEDLETKFHKKIGVVAVTDTNLARLIEKNAVEDTE